MAVKKTTGSQKQEILYDLRLIKEKYPDLIIVTCRKEAHFINGHNVLYLSARKNYSYIKSINKEPVKVTKPMKKVSPLFNKYLVCISCGLFLNLSRIDKLDNKEKNCKIIFDDASDLTLKKEEGKVLCKLARNYCKSLLSGNDKDQTT